MNDRKKFLNLQRKKTKKKYAVKLKLFFWDLKHYAVKLIFHIFRKKKWPHFSKMDILKMSNFGKRTNKFIQLFLCGLLFMGTILWEIVNMGTLMWEIGHM